MIVATSRFVVANDLDDDVAEAFAQRPHQVDAADGFLRMEVIRNLSAPKEFMLLTWWDDVDTYHRWHRSHDYSASHKGIPKGLKLQKGETVVCQWQHLTD